LVTFILPEQFASSTAMKVERDQSDIEELQGNGLKYNQYDPYFLFTEENTIQSEAILSNVVERLNLNSEWGKKYNEGQPLKNAESIAILRRQLDVKQRRNTTIIDVKAFSDSPTEAARLANAVAETYKQWRFDRGSRLVKAGVAELENQLKEHDEKLEAAKQALADLRDKLQISDIDAASMGPQMLTTTEEYKRYVSSRFELERLFKGKQETYAKLNALSEKELRDVLPGFLTDPTLTELINELNAADQRHAALANEYGPKNPEMQRVDEQRDLLNNKINDRIHGIMKLIETQVATAKAELDSTVEAVETARLLDSQKLTTSRPYFDKKSELQDMLDYRRLLMRKINIENTDLRLPKSAQVEIIESAAPDIKPVRPKKTLNIILGVVIGLVVGVGLAFFIEYLDTSVKTIDDVERLLQSPVLGVIPQNVGYLMEEGAESPHAEAYRVLRTNLLFARKDDKLNSIAVVSAGAGEGKSTTVLNLATVFAQSGERVVVVDSDLRRPTLHKIMRVTNNLGLTNYLLKQNTLDEVIQTTNIDKLDFLASGKLPSSSLGILSSSQMKDLIGDLKQRYDYVFFDSPPIMGVSDASILASEVDVTVQVIQYRRYPQPMNVRAKQLIEKVGGNLVGIVLNNINMSQDESYYYYSGYYHDYYAKNEDSEPQPERKPADEKPGGDIKQKY